MSDTSGKYPDVLTGSIPEAKSGVTGSHIFALMLEVEKRARKNKLPLIGHCTDSASNALKGLIMLASPSTYEKFCIQFIGLPISSYRFFSPMLRPPYPSTAYPCWDHSCRTSVRNLMNDKITVVCGVLPSAGDGLQQYKTATIQDIHTLKLRHPNAT